MGGKLVVALYLECTEGWDEYDPILDRIVRYLEDRGWVSNTPTNLIWTSDHASDEDMSRIGRDLEEAAALPRDSTARLIVQIFRYVESHAFTIDWDGSRIPLG